MLMELVMAEPRVEQVSREFSPLLYKQRPCTSPLDFRYCNILYYFIQFGCNAQRWLFRPNIFEHVTHNGLVRQIFKT